MPLMNERSAERAQIPEDLELRPKMPRDPRKIESTLPHDYVFDPQEFEGCIVPPNFVIESRMLYTGSNANSVDRSEEGSLNSFKEEVFKFPLLNRELEQIIFTHMGKGSSVDDLKADPSFWEAFGEVDREKIEHLLNSSSSIKDILMNANMRLVIKNTTFARGKLPLTDLIAEGSRGLQRAVEEFDIGKGYKLSTYATYWIRQVMHRAIADHSRTLRIPVHSFEAANKLSRIIDKFYLENGRAPEYHELVALCPANGIEKSRLEMVARAVFNGTISGIISLDAPLDVGGSTFGDFIENPNSRGDIVASEAISNIDRDRFIDTLRMKLKPREFAMVSKYFGLFDDKTATLQEIGGEFGITRERVRQIIKKSLDKLKSDEEFKRVYGLDTDD